MNPLGAMNRPAVAGALLGLVLAALPAVAQSDIRVTVPTVTDSRSRFKAETPWEVLSLHAKAEGTGLEQAKGFRITVTGAKDDVGNALTPESDKSPEWGDDATSMKLWVQLKGVAREASTVTVAGNLEVFIPSRDPASEVKVEKVFEKAGKPIVSMGLKDAKIEVLVIPLEKTPESSVILVGWVKQLERVREIRVVRPDGTDIKVNGQSSSSDGEQKQLQLSCAEQPPPDAGLVFTIMTEKAVLSVPFELKDIPLP